MKIKSATEKNPTVVLGVYFLSVAPAVLVNMISEERKKEKLKIFYYIEMKW